MVKTPKPQPPVGPARVRRGYFECRFGQLHLHNSMPPGGGFEEGTALLCIQGASGTGRVFAPFMALACRDRSGYAPDLPGLGESDPTGASPTVAEYAAALGDFIDTMRLRRLDVLSCRGGAFIAAELALARPEQIGRVVMVSVPVPQRGQRSEPAAAASLSEGERRLLEALGQFPARERLSRLSQKLLVLRPKDDLWEATGRIREVLPAARVLDLDLTGEALFASAPERLYEAVRDFLRG
jgi:pimeloyl-ACP methyl ester carboxylesterase